MAEPPQSSAYQRLKVRLFLISLVLDLLLLVVFIVSGWTNTLRDFALEQTSWTEGVRGIYIGIFFSILYVLHFPLKVYAGFVVEHRFNLSTQRFSKWFLDDLKKTALSFVLFFVFVQAVYFFLERHPERWWIMAGVFWMTASYVLARFMPQVVIPLFYKYLPVEDSELKERVREMFAACRVPLKEVQVIDFSSKTRKANAFICGMGNSRRIILSDTLLSNFTVPEILAVVAHELGHYKHRDLLKFFVVNAFTIFAGLFLTDLVLRALLDRMGFSTLHDIAFFPVLALTLSVLGILVSPFMNGYTRFVERRADIFCLKQIRDPQVFITMMEKFGAINLSEWQPGRLTEIFLYDHPPLAKRIQLAREFTTGGI